MVLDTNDSPVDEPLTETNASKLDGLVSDATADAGVEEVDLKKAAENAIMFDSIDAGLSAPCDSITTYALELVGTASGGACGEERRQAAPATSDADAMAKEEEREPAAAAAPADEEKPSTKEEATVPDAEPATVEPTAAKESPVDEPKSGAQDEKSSSSGSNSSGKLSLGKKSKLGLKKIMSIGKKAKKADEVEEKSAPEAEDAADDSPKEKPDNIEDDVEVEAAPESKVEAEVEETEVPTSPQSCSAFFVEEKTSAEIEDAKSKTSQEEEEEVNGDEGQVAPRATETVPTLEEGSNVAPVASAGDGDATSAQESEPTLVEVLYQKAESYLGDVTNMCGTINALDKLNTTTEVVSSTCAATLEKINATSGGVPPACGLDAAEPKPVTEASGEEKKTAEELLGTSPKSTAGDGEQTDKSALVSPAMSVLSIATEARTFFECAKIDKDEVTNEESEKEAEAASAKNSEQEKLDKSADKAREALDGGENEEPEKEETSVKSKKSFRLRRNRSNQSDTKTPTRLLSSKKVKKFLSFKKSKSSAKKIEDKESDKLVELPLEEDQPSPFADLGSKAFDSQSLTEPAEEAPAASNAVASAESEAEESKTVNPADDASADIQETEPSAEAEETKLESSEKLEESSPHES